MLETSKLKLFLLFIMMIFIGLFSVNNYRTKAIAEKQAQEAIENAKIVKKSVNLEHLKCLATAIYFEAGHEAFIGQVAVARVVMNRVAHGFGGNPCKVVYQTTIITDKETEETRKLCQFSWVCEQKAIPNKLSIRYKQAESIARDILAEDKWNDVLPGNVLFFHSVTVNPQWRYRRVKIIGNHVFYSKGK